MKSSFITTTALTTAIGFASFALFAGFAEPQIVLAVTDQVVVNLTVDEGITISDGATTTMTNLSTSNNESTGASAWTVTTNSNDGYTLSVTASTDEAMVHTASSTIMFSDFNSGSGTPTAWDSGKGSSIYTFGFSAYGTDTVTGTWGSGSSCGSGTVPTNLNYAGFASSTPRTIATKGTVTSTSGVTTNICFAAEQVGVFAPSGSYQATVTGTAVVN